MSQIGGCVFEKVAGDVHAVPHEILSLFQADGKAERCSETSSSHECTWR